MFVEHDAELEQKTRWLVAETMPDGLGTYYHSGWSTRSKAREELARLRDTGEGYEKVYGKEG